ncbi:MAG: alpha-L-rhamnosidase C-terminal domain-containing protein, partial [Caldilinea sp.]
YDLLLQESHPSWLYPLTKGATSIWERWNGIQPNGEFFNPAMNSFNHYALGAIGDWIYRTIGGIGCDQAAPGYRHVIVRPQPGGGITWARTTFESLYGEIRVTWEIVDGIFTLDVVAPPNTTATIHLPITGDILESSRPLQPSTAGIHRIEHDPQSTIVTVGAGAYHFQASYAPIPSLLSPPPNRSYRAPRYSIHTSVGSVYADDAAHAAVLAALPDQAEFLATLMKQHCRRPYSLHQLAAMSPDILTPQRLAAIDRRLSEL